MMLVWCNGMKMLMKIGFLYILLQFNRVAPRGKEGTISVGPLAWRSSEMLQYLPKQTATIRLPHLLRVSAMSGRAYLPPTILIPLKCNPSTQQTAHHLNSIPFCLSLEQKAARVAKARCEVPMEKLRAKQIRFMLANRSFAQSNPHKSSYWPGISKASNKAKGQNYLEWTFIIQDDCVVFSKVDEDQDKNIRS